MNFRKQFAPKVKQKRGRRRNQNRYGYDNTVCYGKPYRPSTPMKTLMSNVYGQQAEKHIKSLYEFHSQKVCCGVFHNKYSGRSQIIKFQLE